MKSNIKLLETICELTGLRTQGEKCHGFYIKPTKDSYTINDCPAWTISDTPFNMIDLGSSEKYLGLQIDAWTGITKPIRTLDARIKRHNYICHMLSKEGKKKDWVAYLEPHIRDSKNKLFKPDLIFVKEHRAYVVDVMVRFEHNTSTLADSTKEKVEKYQHPHKKIQDLTNAAEVNFVGFQLGARGKWYNKNYKLLSALGLSKSRQGQPGLWPPEHFSHL
ncbi:hypothetical protein WISP_106536 [Willisornis vidua]|uniref:Uncharacterized protein n=1 Tax=Willisornis vidua TaxID=1566151 RepID=A0ABQ9CWV3_9PASS|nr:hypothetical protein WISP_106536 [Willisornis vidua]